ncbi:MAG TPA: TolC family protein [Polyangia bacterium]
MREAVAGLVLLIPSVVMAAAPGGADPAVEKVTLASAVQRALQRNPSVAVAVQEVERADALITQARAGWLPILMGNGLYTRLDSDRTLTTTTKDPTTGQTETHTNRLAAENQVSGNLQLTVPLVAAPAWTATGRAKSAKRTAQASETDVRRQVAQSTARAYITVVAQHRLVAASETARDTAKAHYDYAHTRLQGGIGRAIDEVRAAQDLATVETQLQANLARLAVGREALGVLLGTEGPVDAIDEVDLPAPPSMADAVAGARTNRTDVKLLDMRVASAKRAAGDTWAYYMPYLAAVGTPFVQYPASLTQPEVGWQAQLVLTLPLYDGGMRNGIGRERDALLAEARSNLEAGLRQAQAEIRINFEAMIRADLALTSARDAARLAKRAMELATIAYKAGATTNLEVIDAARSARDADTAAAQAEDLSRQARLDLLVASGRFP